MAQINAVIIRRSDDENTVALVSAACDPEMVEDTNDLYGAIARATTRWARRGAAAKALLEDTHGDINIGDLCAEGIDARLRALLRKEGVTELKIDCHAGGATPWDYDDNLYDESHLEQ
jgi:hypothetical protein